MSKRYLLPVPTEPCGHPDKRAKLDFAEQFYTQDTTCHPGYFNNFQHAQYLPSLQHCVPRENLILNQISPRQHVPVADPYYMPPGSDSQYHMDFYQQNNYQQPSGIFYKELPSVNHTQSFPSPCQNVGRNMVHFSAINYPPPPTKGAISNDINNSQSTSLKPVCLNAKSNNKELRNIPSIQKQCKEPKKIEEKEMGTPLIIEKSNQILPVQAGQDKNDYKSEHIHNDDTKSFNANKLPMVLITTSDNKVSGNKIHELVKEVHEATSDRKLLEMQDISQGVSDKLPEIAEELSDQKISDNNMLDYVCLQSHQKNCQSWASDFLKSIGQNETLRDKFNKPSSQKSNTDTNIDLTEKETEGSECIESRTRSLEAMSSRKIEPTKSQNFSEKTTFKLNLLDKSYTSGSKDKLPVTNKNYFNKDQNEPPTQELRSYIPMKRDFCQSSRFSYCDNDESFRPVYDVQYRCFGSCNDRFYNNQFYAPHRAEYLNLDYHHFESSNYNKKYLNYDLRQSESSESHALCDEIQRFIEKCKIKRKDLHYYCETSNVRNIVKESNSVKTHIKEGKIKKDTTNSLLSTKKKTDNYSRATNNDKKSESALTKIEKEDLKNKTKFGLKTSNIKDIPKESNSVTTYDKEEGTIKNAITQNFPHTKIIKTMPENYNETSNKYKKTESFVSTKRRKDDFRNKTEKTEKKPIAIVRHEIQEKKSKYVESKSSKVLKPKATGIQKIKNPDSKTKKPTKSSSEKREKSKTVKNSKNVKKKEVEKALEKLTRIKNKVKSYVKQINSFNKNIVEETPLSALKSVVQIPQVPKGSECKIVANRDTSPMYSIDLRNKLNQISYSKISNNHNMNKANTQSTRDNLIFNIQNNEYQNKLDSSPVLKSITKSENGDDIHVVINLVYKKSHTHIATNTQEDVNDLSFLDDINIDEIAEYLKISEPNAQENTSNVTMSSNVLTKSSNVLFTRQINSMETENADTLLNSLWSESNAFKDEDWKFSTNKEFSEYDQNLQESKNNKDLDIQSISSDDLQESKNNRDLDIQSISSDDSNTSVATIIIEQVNNIDYDILENNSTNSVLISQQVNSINKDSDVFDDNPTDSDFFCENDLQEASENSVLCSKPIDTCLLTIQNKTGCNKTFFSENNNVLGEKCYQKIQKNTVPNKELLHSFNFNNVFKNKDSSSSVKTECQLTEETAYEKENVNSIINDNELEYIDLKPQMNNGNSVIEGLQRSEVKFNIENAVKTEIDLKEKTDGENCVNVYSHTVNMSALVNRLEFGKVKIENALETEIDSKENNYSDNVAIKIENVDMDIEAESVNETSTKDNDFDNTLKFNVGDIDLSPIKAEKIEDERRPLAQSTPKLQLHTEDTENKKQEFKDTQTLDLDNKLEQTDKQIDKGDILSLEQVHIILNTGIKNKISIEQEEKTKLYEAMTEHFVKNVETRMCSYLNMKYTVTSLLHKGKFSNILQCKDVNKKVYALKVISNERHRHSLGFKKETMLKFIQKEIPKENLYCVYLHEGFGVMSRWCLLMDYYPVTLQQAMKEQNKCFYIERVQALSRHLVAAVLALKVNNVVHSDIKPSHLMMNSTFDQLKLCGFDSSYHIKDVHLMPNIGSISYRAPEVVLGHSAGFGIDVWATAAVMYELATNMVLFPAKSNNQLMYQHLCTLGEMPRYMLRNCMYRENHFAGFTFLKKTSQGTVIPVKKFIQNKKLSTPIFEQYLLHWGTNKKQNNIDSAKLYGLKQLLTQMLSIDPERRLTIESVYSSNFILNNKTQFNNN